MSSIEDYRSQMTFLSVDDDYRLKKANLVVKVSFINDNHITIVMLLFILMVTFTVLLFLKYQKS